MGSILGNVARAVVGGLMGGDDEQKQTASKDPWAPAVKPLTNSLNTLQDLERYYQKTPFNRLQQQGYQNTFSDIDQYRTQIAPGLMNFANNAMTSSYQRGPRNSQVEALQGQMPMQAQQRPQMMQQGQDGSYAPQGGLLGAMGQTQGMGGAMQGGQMSYQGVAPQGLLTQQGVFQAPSQGTYGLLDFTQLNPFTATNGIPQAVDKKPTSEEEELERRRREEKARMDAYMASERQGAGA